MGSYDPVSTADDFPSEAWAAATFCGPNGGNCVEVNLGTRWLVGVRDGKRAAGPVLVFEGVGWRRFLRAAGSQKLGLG